MRCLHCGKRLSLLRKFSDGEFCSAEHRQLFQHQQNDLALARLIESQVRIERPKPKEPPKPQKQAKPSLEPADQHVPEAPLLTEWFHPPRRRVVFIPATDIIQPEIALGWPVSGLVLEQYGFHKPGKLPLNWAPQPAGPGSVMPEAVPIYANGLEIPGLAAPAPALVAEVPQLASPLAFAAPLPVSGLPLSCQTTLESIPVQAYLQEPRLALLTQPPDPVEIVPDEVAPPEEVIAGELPLCAGVPLAFAASPFAPSAPPVLGLSLSGQFTLPTEARKPVRAFEPLSDSFLSHEDALTGSLSLCETVSLEFSGQPVGLNPPAILALPISSEHTLVDGPAIPAQTVPALCLALSEDSSLQPVATALPLHLTATLKVPHLESLATPQTAALPALPVEGLPEPSLTTCNRSARLKTKAVAAAAGGSVHTPNAQPFPSELEPSTPHHSWMVDEPTFPQPHDLQTLATSGFLAASFAVLEGSPVPVAAAGWTPLAPASPFRPEIEVFEPVAFPDEEPELIAIPVRSAALKLGAPEEIPPRFVEPVPPTKDSPPILETQLRLLDGRAVSGPAAPPRSSTRDAAGLWADAIAADPLLTSSRLTLDHADGSGPRDLRKRESARKGKSLLTFSAASLPGRRFWSHAPADLKWVALGLPLILAIVIYSFKGSAPKIEVGQQVAGVDKTVLGTQLNSLQKVILNRAAIKLFDDFRGGLGSWQGREGWSKTWRYGEASFLEPGQLALYTPTLGMSDYTVQFLGQIERRSLNWVFRAKDEKNYYAMRIVITKNGPLPEANVVRYAVIDGKEQSMKTLPIPFPVRSDTLYLVRMDVQGNRFTTYLQGGIVDSFDDDRLESGGVGFYSPKGDRSFLRWVEVTHQYDYLGRLCALLAPYNVQADGRKSE